MRIDAIATVVQAYLVTRWRAAHLRSRAAIDRHHDRQLKRLMLRAAQELPFYRAFAGLPLRLGRWSINLPCWKISVP